MMFYKRKLKGLESCSLCGSPFHRKRISTKWLPERQMYVMVITVRCIRGCRPYVQGHSYMRGDEVQQAELTCKEIYRRTKYHLLLTVRRLWNHSNSTSHF